MANELFQLGNAGYGAVVSAVREVLANYHKTVELVVADHPIYGNEVYSRVVIGVARVDGALCVRYAGEGDKVNGPNSSSIISSGAAESLDDGYVIGALMAHLMRTVAQVNGKVAAKSGPNTAAWIFRGDAYRAHGKAKLAERGAGR